MNVVIVGCGRVGSRLADQLEGAGHDVCVVDKRAESFRRLSDTYRGRTLVGIGFDRDLLKEAGVDENAAVVAVTSGDNSNILVARVARELFGARRVVARIYDPQRAAIYGRLGIPTVATAEWTAGRVIADLFPEVRTAVWSDPSSDFHLVEVRVPPELAGSPVGAWEERAGVRANLVTRLGRPRLAHADLILQEGDLVHVVGHRDRIANLVLDAGEKH